MSSYETDYASQPSSSENNTPTVMLLIQGDTKKREILKNPTKIEEIQKKKNYRQKLNHYYLPFKRQ